jgi:hypothetical protein
MQFASTREFSPALPAFQPIGQAFLQTRITPARLLSNLIFQNICPDGTGFMWIMALSDWTLSMPRIRKGWMPLHVKRGRPIGLPKFLKAKHIMSKPGEKDSTLLSYFYWINLKAGNAGNQGAFGISIFLLGLPSAACFFTPIFAAFLTYFLWSWGNWAM